MAGRRRWVAMASLERMPHGEGMDTASNPEDPPISVQLRRTAIVIGGLLGAMWILEIVDTVLQGHLDQYGIVPRTVYGLMGIPLAPFLHGGFQHLLSNTTAILVFGGMLMLRSPKEFAFVSLATTFVGGALVWAFAGGGVHIGASGVVFGLFGYLVAMGFYERRIGSMLLSIALIVGYGGLIFGVLPGQRGISWESHLCGMVVGVLCARWLGRRRRKARLLAEGSSTGGS